MTFEEAGSRFAELKAQHAAGRMTAQELGAAAAQLTVTDANGVWWQIDPSSGEWLRWDGSAWTKPQAASAVASLPPPPSGAKQWIWDIFMMLGSGGMAAAWYWYSGMAETAPDKRSCTAMVVMPLLFIVLRKPMDAALRPLQKFRCKIPPMVLAGTGVAIPFLVANYLYAKGYSQFDYLFRTYVVSTLLSYVVLRTPAGLPGGR